MARHFVDPRLRSLQEDFESYEKDLALKFKELSRSNGHSRFAASRAILAILAALRARVSIFANSELRKFYQETDREIVKRLKAAGVTVLPLPKGSYFPIGQQMVADVDRAIASVSTLNQQGLEGNFLHLLPLSRIHTLTAEEIGPAGAKAFADLATKRQVSVPTTGGRTRSYGISYYLSMVLASAFVRARVQAALDRTAEGGGDLVRVSPNPSTIGDFCDAYAGKVFSVNGERSDVPKLSQAVGGGPPFHVNCLHWLINLPPNYQPTRGDIVHENWLVRNQQDAERVVKEWGRR